MSILGRFAAWIRGWQPSTKHYWTGGMVACGLIMAILVGSAALKGTPKNGGDMLSPFFSFEGVTRHPEAATVIEGKKLVFNTHILNPAPRTPAYNAVCEQGLFLESPNGDGVRLAGEAFDSQTRAKREDYWANKIPNGAVVGNAPQWYTLQTSELTSGQVSDILDGHLTVYILLWQAWTDSPDLSDQKHESCYCEFLQAPIPV
jgi:hypothetical protein